MELIRYSQNPILSPSKNWWEINATFNPGATIFQNKVLLLYRAIGGDSFSRFGLAISSDGFEFERFAEPTFEADINNPYERLGVEDARITQIDDTFYICYTAASVYPANTYGSGRFAPSLSHPAPWRVRPSLISTKDFKTFARLGILLDIDTKDASIFPEKFGNNFALLHRAYPNLYLTFSADFKTWATQKILLEPRPDFWDSERVGGGSTPIKTEKGYLVFYHGTNMNHEYMLGVIMLDKNDPSKILYRSSQPLLVPETPYEKIGATPNVVFTCGAVEKDNKYLVYYGAADKVSAVAYIDKMKLLSEINT